MYTHRNTGFSTTLLIWSITLSSGFSSDSRFFHVILSPYLCSEPEVSPWWADIGDDKLRCDGNACFWVCNGLELGTVHAAILLSILTAEEDQLDKRISEPGHGAVRQLPKPLDVGIASRDVPEISTLDDEHVAGCT